MLYNSSNSNSQFYTFLGGVALGAVVATGIDRLIRSQNQNQGENATQGSSSSSYTVLDTFKSAISSTMSSIIGPGSQLNNSEIVTSGLSSDKYNESDENSNQGTKSTTTAAGEDDDNDDSSPSSNSNQTQTQTQATVPENAKPQEGESCVGVEHEQAGKARGCEGCPNQAACASGEAKKVDPALQKIADRLKNVEHKILILSGKGGVGKSTVSTQLAFELARRKIGSNNESEDQTQADSSDDYKYEVGLLDIDICGPSLPQMLGLRGQEVHRSADGWSPVYVQENLGCMSIGFLLPEDDSAVVWRGPKKNGMIRQFLTDVNWGATSSSEMTSNSNPNGSLNNIDFLLIDTPPGTSDEHITLVSYLEHTHITGAIIVTSPQEVALCDVRKEVNFCKTANVHILGVVENMGGFLNMNSDKVLKLCEDYNIPYLGKIPLAVEVGLAGERGKRTLGEESGKAFEEMCDKMLGEVEKRGKMG